MIRCDGTAGLKITRVMQVKLIKSLLICNCCLRGCHPHQKTQQEQLCTHTGPSSRKAGVIMYDNVFTEFC